MVSGDTYYDDEKILRFIVEEMQALPVIPQNPRRGAGENYTIEKGKGALRRRRNSSAGLLPLKTIPAVEHAGTDSTDLKDAFGNRSRAFLFTPEGWMTGG